MKEIVLKWLLSYMVAQVVPSVFRAFKKWCSSRADRQGIVPDIYGAELLNVLIAENPNSVAQLVAALGGRQNLVEICTNQKELGPEQIAALSWLYCIPQEVFLPMSQPRTCSKHQRHSILRACT